MTVKHQANKILKGDEKQADIRNAPFCKRLV